MTLDMSDRVYAMDTAVNMLVGSIYASAEICSHMIGRRDWR
jgi:hypothetical protein